MKITNCKTNHLTNPLGYMMTTPVFSYIVSGAAGKCQTEARVCVSKDAGFSDLVFDSGFSAGIDSLAFSAEMELAPRTRYYWTVTVRTDADEEAVSDVNWFETGKMAEPWQAKWIACDSTNKRHPVFRKDIDGISNIKEARLYICGLGLYEAYLNGEKISDEFLTPYCNNYNKWLQYQTYDVTSQLKKGGKLEVLLGNGWYKGRFGLDMERTQKPYYGDTWKLIAELHIAHIDGSETVIATDESWQVGRSEITESSIYDGEHYDATLADEQPAAVTLCTEPFAPLTERLSAPVRIQEELTPIEIIYTPTGETVIDLGQNMAGIFHLSVNEPKGALVHLQFGEILQNGNFYRDNLRSAKAEYSYISDGNARVIQPHFTFYGYRYVKVEGITGLKKEDFTALVLYSELPKTGTLTTGHNLVNRLIQNTEWGQKGNFIDVPTDCPQRDERMGWTGDAQVFCATSCFLRDSYAFFKKYLYDLKTEQEEHKGAVPDVIPSVGFNLVSSVWGDAACIIPWNLYLFYGDKAILAEQFDSMKAWVDYITSVDGDSHHWRDIFTHGDHLALDNPKGGVNQRTGGTDTGFISSVYYAQSANLVSQAARILDKATDAEYYEHLYKTIIQDVRDEYFSKTGRICINTQTALLMSLYYHLLDSNERTIDALIKKFKDSDNKLQTGFIGTSILCNCLSENGLGDLAYEFLLNEEYPGWLYSVKLGATTIWERWNSVLPDGSISSTGMNSLNHYAYGSIVEWMYRRCAGINPMPDNPGFRKIRLIPTPNYKLQRLDAEFCSPAGTYKSSWNIRDEKHLELKFSIPFGCTAELVLPFAPETIYSDSRNPMFLCVKDGVCHLTPGEYSVSYETTETLRHVLSTSNTIEELLQNSKAKEVLTRKFPQFEDTPPHMQKSSFRKLMEQFSGSSASELLRQLDLELADLT